jgi:hypothetical protein
MLDLWFKWENLPNTKKYYYFCLQCRGTRGVLNSAVSEDYNLHLTVFYHFYCHAMICHQWLSQSSSLIYIYLSVSWKPNLG